MSALLKRADPHLLVLRVLGDALPGEEHEHRMYNLARYELYRSLDRNRPEEARNWLEAMRVAVDGYLREAGRARAIIAADAIAHLIENHGSTEDE